MKHPSRDCSIRLSNRPRIAPRANGLVERRDQELVAGADVAAQRADEQARLLVEAAAPPAGAVDEGLDRGGVVAAS